MKALKDAILREGIAIGTKIVKVDSFLNHKIDVALSRQMGEAFYAEFSDMQVDCILTIEASGISIAMMTAQAFGDIPVIIAKKGDHSNIGNDVYTADVYSFTHQRMNTIRVSKKYLTPGLRVLIIDDFLANGEALMGLRSILEEAGCVLVGAGICVEKGFQHGGAMIRSSGLKVGSLAIVDDIKDGQVILRED